MKKLIFIFVLVLAGNAGATDYFMGGDTMQATTYPQSDSVAQVFPFTAANDGFADSMQAIWKGNYHGPYSLIYIIAEIEGADTIVIDSTSPPITLPALGSDTARLSASFKERVQIVSTHMYLIGAYLNGAGGTNGNVFWWSSCTAAQQVRWTQTPTASCPSPLTGQYFDNNGRKPAGGVWYSDQAPPASNPVKTGGSGVGGAGQW